MMEIKGMNARMDNNSKCSLKINISTMCLIIVFELIARHTCAAIHIIISGEFEKVRCQEI